MTDVISSLNHCAQQARGAARLHYLCAISLSPHQRGQALAAIALETELRSIALKAAEEMIGHIRFAWWRETLEGLAAGQARPGHPVLELLQVYAKAEDYAALLSLVDAVEESYPAVQPQPVAYLDTVLSQITPAITPALKAMQRHPHPVGLALKLLWLRYSPARG